MLRIYGDLAARGEHLLHGLIPDHRPVQWQHYPDDDAIDADHGYQWFYHSHAPQDRPDAREHGHFHLFARRPLWSRRLRSRAERAFAALTCAPREPVATRHLLGIGLDERGLPVSLFTVNSWVTGDLMLSAPTTAGLLAAMRLDTGHRAIDGVLECVMALCAAEIDELLAARDAVLAKSRAPHVLEDRSLDVLSELPIQLDGKLRG
ncbi:MAG: hypothetical protein KGN77_11045 [Xanthomonadaceae bacterium]|nr:hypothetical protein [Xanthomonadaceae bacterium]MDE1964715.1 hypothetical protein [Xanthomonadaceae bacterium]